jgi:hypothetical protein
MTSDSTQASSSTAGSSTVFSCALECCGKLQQAFPTDQRLRSIISQLEHWVDAQAHGGAKPGARRTRRVRIDPRDLRPLSEEVATLVHKAAVRAQELKLS